MMSPMDGPLDASTLKEISDKSVQVDNALAAIVEMRLLEKVIKKTDERYQESEGEE